MAVQIIFAQKVRNLLARVSAIGVKLFAAVFIVQQAFHRLTVVNRGTRHLESPNELVLRIDIHMILVAEIADVSLLRPACVGVFLPLLVRLRLPRLGSLAFFLDLLVLFAAIALFWGRDDRGINDLPLFRGKTVGRKRRVKLLE